MAPGLNGVSNGPLEVPGRTSLYSMPCTCTWGAMQVLTSYFPPVLWFNMDSFYSSNLTNNNEGLGSPFDETQSMNMTTSSELVRYPRWGTSNPAEYRSGIAGTSKQHTEATAGVQGVPMRMQKGNRWHIQKKWDAQRTMASYNTIEKDNEYKRLRSDDSFLSCQGPTVKKPKSDFCPKGYTQAQTVKFGVVKDTFPSDKLSQEEANLIQMEILNRIDTTPDGVELPKILGSVLQGGILLFYCDNNETVDWMKAAFHGNNNVIGCGMALKVLSAKELPKPCKVAFKTKDTYTKDADVLLKRLNRLNPELKSEEWRVLQKLVEAYSIRWIFEVEYEAVEAIRRADFGAYTGVDRGVFKILRDPNTKTDK